MKEEDYIKKWLDKSLSDEEKRLFAQPRIYEVDVSMSEALERFRATDYDTEKEYERLNQKRQKSKVQVSPSYVLFKVAAIFVLVLSIVFYISSNYFSSDVDLVTSKMELSLPDATSVYLNTQSKLTYDEKNWSSQRKAYLEGEGYFNVTRGTKFNIISQSGVVSVLGTAFNIKDRDNFFEVKCYHGLVKVEVGETEYLLSAQQALRIVDGVEIKKDFYEKTRPSWIKGESSFEREPYIQVIRELERQYGISVKYENINTHLSFSGKFTHSDLTLALESVTKPLNLGFEVSGQEVRLSSDIKQN